VVGLQQVIDCSEKELKIRTIFWLKATILGAKIGF
jgi:hypothetical protein